MPSRYVLLLAPLAVIALVATVVAVAFVSDDDGSPDDGSLKIEDAKAFHDYPVYWLGENFGDLPLEGMGHYVYEGTEDMPFDDSQNQVYFHYGSCRPTGDSGCPVPASVTTEPYCQVPPELPVGASDPFYLRGALARYVGGGLRLWTGNVSVQIFARNSPELQRAAEHLVIANTDTFPPTEEDLPAPDDIECPIKAKVRYPSPAPSPLPQGTVEPPAYLP